MRDVKVNNIFAAFEIGWVGRLSCRKGDTNEQPSNVCDGAANTPGNKEKFVDTADDALGKYICQWNLRNGARWSRGWGTGLESRCHITNPKKFVIKLKE